MSSALEMAQYSLRDAQSYYETSEEKDGNALYRSLSERAYQQAAIYAAVAQAEALERIAAALEKANEMHESERAYSPIPDIHDDVALSEYRYRKEQAEAFMRAERGES